MILSVMKESFDFIGSLENFSMPTGLWLKTFLRRRLPYAITTALSYGLMPLDMKIVLRC